MQNTPAGWPRLSSSLFYQDPIAAIAFLEAAFGFQTRIRVDAPDGSRQHSELCFGDAVVMVNGERKAGHMASPLSVGGQNTQALFLYVDDVDAHCARAEAAGARIVQALADTDDGPEYWVDRGYGAIDPEGHRWWFAQRIRG